MAMSPEQVAAKLDALQSLRLAMRRVCADLAESADATPEQILEAARSLHGVARKMKALEVKYVDSGGALRQNRFSSRARR